MGPEIHERDETKPAKPVKAPGAPGKTPCWNTGAKTAVGSAVTAESRIWFTLAHGHVNEIYFPDVDRANTRFVRFIVAAEGGGVFSDEATDTDFSIEPEAPGVPAFRINSHCKQKRYRLQKQIIVDPARDALLMRVQFEPLLTESRLKLFVFCDPHVGDQGKNNSAWAGDYKGIPMLFANNDGLAMALACSTPFKSMQCGFLGTSDGLEDLRLHGELSTTYNEAENGNIVLLGEVDWRSCAGQFTIAAAFGGRTAEAGLQARAALCRDFELIRKEYVAGWNDYHAQLSDLSGADDKSMFRVSAAVARIHESKRFPGAFVASLSIPWGFDRGDKNTGGYHVIWPRDLCETVLGLLSCGDAVSGRRALFYLACTQDQDGHWNQNQWLDGSRHWTSRQMDETAYPVLLADALRRSNELKDHDPWPMIRNAAGYLAQNGPLAQQDRWEEVTGYATFSMAVEIAGVLAAADFAELNGEFAIADFLRSTADAWNEAVDELTYVEGTALAHRCEVTGYYVRVTPPEAIEGLPLRDLCIDLKNHKPGCRKKLAAKIVSPDALALVRFGLRAADDPRILNTVAVIDSTLRIVTRTGPVWRRYVDDGYGEHEDGSPFNKTGVGRGWPLLAGERAHYEIARGNFDCAEALRRTIAAQTSDCGLIPEQVWDADDIPERELYNGRPSGSGMPLVWAHAEYIKLLRSLRDREVWNLPPQTVQRYIRDNTQAEYQIWTPQQQRARLKKGKNLRIDLLSAATIEWTPDDWYTIHQNNTNDSGLGVHWAVLKTNELAAGASVRFRLLESCDGGLPKQEFRVLVA